MFRFVFVFIILFISLSFAEKSAIAVLQSTSNTNNVISGTVTFFMDDNDNEVTVTAEINGLSGFSGSLGMSVYTYGDITDNSGNAASDIWIGSGSQNHGCPDDTNRREGDLGSWNVNNGFISESKSLNLLTLSGSTSIIGRSVILNDIPDPCTSSGNLGTRIAMGVIGISSDDDDNNDASQGSNPNTLICRLQPTINCPQCQGTVWFEEQSSSIKVTAQVFGLDFKSHGFHIHQYGDITSNDGTSLGAHYNPGNNNHGLPSNPNRHEGDMGNIQSYDDDGTAWYEFNNEKIRSTGSIIGRGVVLHEKQDNGSGEGCGETGNAGSRYATCVIGITSDDTDVPDPNIIIDDNFFNIDCTIIPSFSSATYATTDQYSFSPASTSDYLPPFYYFPSTSVTESPSSSSNGNILFINISLISFLLLSLLF